MNKEEIEKIIDERLEKKGIAISRLIEFKDTMKTKEVARYLNMSKEWVQKNKDLLGGKRINKRGDLAFKTDRIVQYYINQKLL